MSKPRKELYVLNIDGPIFREQRQFLVDLLVMVQLRQLDRKDEECIHGLLNLIDAIADQAHDDYGIDCLLTHDEEE